MTCLQESAQLRLAGTTTILFAPHATVDTVYCSARRIVCDEAPNLADKSLHEEHRKPTVRRESCQSVTLRSEA